jgi:hypothetical protein
MAILVDCPVCAETLQAPDDAAGKGCPCPVCRAVVSVPLGEAPPPRAAPAAPVPPGRVGACPTCGHALTITPELEGVRVTCPFCQRDFRPDGAERAPPVPKRRRRRFVCPHCGSAERPYRTTRISAAGWTVFAVFLVFFFPLFWVGLLITETEERWYDCGQRVD